MKKLVQLLTTQISEKERMVEVLSVQLAERNRELSEVKASKLWRLVMIIHRIRLWLVPPNNPHSRMIRRLFNFIVLTFRKITRKQSTAHDLTLLRSSNLFDTAWYLANNPDVASTRVDPASHYLYYGGFEGRNPGPNFSSKLYLDTYEDVKKAGINPLVHYLRYGKKDGRLTQPQKKDIPNALFKCPVCQENVNQFLPLPIFYLENMKKYGYPYTTDDAETMNAEQYSCPHCGASDRDRLYACYLDEKISQYHSRDQLYLLDIAPSPALSKFIFASEKKIIRHTADLLIEGVDLVVDIMNMPEIDSDTYDILICSHVLEHVDDDKKALYELYRVLKPGGWGIIMAPIILTIDQIDEDPDVTDVAERWRRFAQDDHVRLYSKAGFIKRVEAAGFSLKQLGIKYFGESVFRQYGITRKSVLYIAEKPGQNTFTSRQFPSIREIQ